MRAETRVSHFAAGESRDGSVTRMGGGAGSQAAGPLGERGGGQWFWSHTFGKLGLERGRRAGRTIFGWQTGVCLLPPWPLRAFRASFPLSALFGVLGVSFPFHHECLVASNTCQAPF